MKKIRHHVIYGISSLLVLTLAMTSCSKSPTSNGDHSSMPAACSNNPYLMKYGCSVERIQQAAEEGNADAQYGLGYMYYYGIDTVKDKPTAELWIQRAAAQGQPLAKKAWSLINSGATFTDLHQSAAGQSATTNSSGVPTGSDMIEQQSAADVAKMNATKPTKPISSELPGYQQQSSTQSVSQATPALTPAHANVAQIDKHSINDPRLASNAKPVVMAMTDKSIRSPKNNATPMGAKSAEQNNVALAKPSSAEPVVAMRDEITENKGQGQDNSRVAMANTQQAGFTVQLMASSEMSDVKSFAAAHHLGSNAHYYQTALNGKPWYMLTYGHYETRQDALVAMQALPKSDDVNHPWVKSLATIDKEVALKKVVA